MKIIGFVIMFQKLKQQLVKKLTILLLGVLCLNYAVAQERITSFIEKAGDADSSADLFLEFQDKYLFMAFHPSYGNEIWITDGTASGTSLLKDINENITGSIPVDITFASTTLDDELYFLADDGVNGRQIWKTDGTSNGTVMVSYFSGLRTDQLTAHNGKIYFIHELQNNLGFRDDIELWTLDPSSGSFERIKIFDAFNGKSYQGSHLGLFFFTFQEEGDPNVRIWRSDGTEAGTFAVSEPLDGTGIGRSTVSLALYTELDGFLYVVTRKSLRVVIVRTDGTVQGTTEHNTLHSANLTVYGDAVVNDNKAYFSFYNEDDQSYRLYEENGQPSGAQLLFSGKSVIPSNLQIIDNKLVFMASNDFSNAVDLMAIDLSTNTVQTLARMEANVAPRRFDFFLRGYLVKTSDNQLVVSYLGDNFAQKSWLYDFSTSTITDLNIGFHIELTPTSFGVIYNAILEGQGSEPFIADAALSSPQQLLNINEQNFGISRLTKFRQTGERLVFFATDGASGTEPRVFDETSDELNVLQELLPGSDGATGGPLDVIEFNGMVYYFARQENGRLAMFETDGTPGNVNFILEYEDFNDWPRALAVYKGDLYAVANDELRKFENNAFVTVKELVSDPMLFFSVQDMKATDDLLYISAVNGYLYASDGTTNGTDLLIDINQTRDLTPVGDELYFVGREDPASYYQIWKTDGTLSGTAVVRDLGAPDPQDLIQFGNSLVFTAHADESGRELWITDGTVNGTQLIRDIQQGSRSGLSQTDYGLLNGELFFAANDGSSGMELWKTDGSTNGTVRVSDINTGSSNSFPGAFQSYNGNLYFNAHTDQLGRELWVSDGTPAGTSNLFDIVSGPMSSQAQPVANTTNDLYFIARNNDLGFQLWGVESTVTSIEDEIFDSGIVLFPNPVAETMHVRFTESPQEVQVEIYDMSLKRHQATVMAGAPVQEIAVKDLNPGLYMIRFTDHLNRVSIKRFIKIAQ